MTEVLDVRKIDMNVHSEEAQVKLAARVLELVRDDFLSIGASEEQIAYLDPMNETNIRRQVRAMENPSVPGVEYAGLHRGDEPDMVGVVKIGPWLRGDAKPFGRKEQIKAVAKLPFSSADTRPRGLHVFSVEQGGTKRQLSRMGLVATRYSSLLPDEAPLNVAAATKDADLRAALTELGATEGPTGITAVGDFEFEVQLRQLSLDTQEDEEQPNPLVFL